MDSDEASSDEDFTYGAKNIDLLAKDFMNLKVKDAEQTETLREQPILNYLRIYQNSLQSRNVNREQEPSVQIRHNETRFKRTFWPPEIPLGASISWDDGRCPPIKLPDSNINLNESRIAVPAVTPFLIKPESSKPEDIIPIYQSNSSSDISMKTISQVLKKGNIRLDRKNDRYSLHRCRNCKLIKAKRKNVVKKISDISMLTVSHFKTKKRSCNAHLPYTCPNCEHKEVNSIHQANVLMQPIPIVEEIYVRKATGSSIESDFLQTPSIFCLSPSDSGSPSPESPICNDEEEISSVDHRADVNRQFDDDLDAFCNKFAGLKFDKK